MSDLWGRSFSILFSAMLKLLLSACFEAVFCCLFFFFLHVYSVILETDCQVVKYNDAGSDRATNKKHQFSPLAQCSVTHKTARPSASSANSTVYSASKVFSLLFHPQVEIFNFLKFALHVYKVNSLPYSVFSISII